MNAQTFTSKVRGILSDNAGRRTVGRQSSGPFLDRGRVAMLAGGDLRVFRKPADRAFKDWAVHILVDCSGSMQHATAYGGRGHKVKAAASCLYQLFGALKAASVGSVSASGFNCRLEDVPPSALKSESACFQYLDQRSSCHDAHGNHDGYDMEESVKRMEATHAQGKIIFVLSDGKPACDFDARCGQPGAADPAGHEQALIKAVAEARKKGIMVLGLGMVANHLGKYYGEQNAGAVMDLSQLFSEAGRLLERNIIRG